MNKYGLKHMKLVWNIWSWLYTYEAGLKHMKLVINIWSWL